jgi:hypothetical protein
VALCDDTFPCWRSRLGKARDLASAAYAQANLNDHVRRPRGHDDEPIAFGDAPAFPLEVLPPWLGVWAAQQVATTLPVDFHSFRRAFNTALAESGVNLQRAMHVAGHSDAKTHMRYVMRGSGMRSIPAGALPQIAASAGSIVTDCDDWTAGTMKSSMISARPAGLEPATRGLEEGSQRTTM